MSVLPWLTVYTIGYIVIAIVAIYLGIKCAIRRQEEGSHNQKASYYNPNCSYPFHLEKSPEHCISYACLIHDGASKEALEENCKGCQYNLREEQK